MASRANKLKHLREMFPRNRWLLRKGDEVIVTAGRSRTEPYDPGPKGRVGTVLKVIRNKRRPQVILDKVLQIQKKIRGDSQNPGRVTLIDPPIPYSNVMLVAPGTEQPTRVENFYVPTDTEGEVAKTRYAKTNFKAILPTYRKKERDSRVGPKCTAAEVAHRQTYFPPVSSLTGFGGGSRRYTTYASRPSPDESSFSASAPDAAFSTSQGVGQGGASTAVWPGSSPGEHAAAAASWTAASTPPAHQHWLQRPRWLHSLFSLLNMPSQQPLLQAGQVNGS